MSQVTTPARAGADTSDYAVIHRAIRSGGHALAAAAETITIADRRRLDAFVRYWQGHAGEILAHHGVEDSIFFPALRQREPFAAAVLDDLDREHLELDRLMDECSEAIGRVAAGASSKAAVAALRRLADVMDDHLDVEDREVVPLFEALFDADEYTQLTKAAAKQIGIGKQAAFTVPYVFHWATPAERQLLMREAPLPFRVLYRLTRRRHERLSALALGA